MENEFSTVKNDGRILQKDNAIFQGKELARVNPAEAEDALRYFANQFSGIEKYVDTSLETLRDEERGPDLLKKLQQLREEVISASAVGDFEALVGKIDTEIRECQPQVPETAGEDAAVEAGTPVAEASKAEVPADEESKAEVSADQAPEAEAPAAEEPDLKVADVESPEGAVPDAESKEASKKEEIPAEGTGEPEAGKEPVEDAGQAKEYAESLAGLLELAGKAEDIAGGSNWQQMQSELENIRFKWNQLLEENADLASEDGYQDILARLDSTQKKVAERKTEWLEKRRERRKENLDKRAKILDQLQDIIDRKKWQAFKQVGNLTSRWDDIKDIPNEPEAEEQQKKYDALVQEFNDKKVAFLVRKAQKEEENLVGKLTVLDKMNQIVSSVGPETGNWEQKDKEIEELTRQWRKIGHVPGEQSDTIWERFKSVRDEYFAKKMEHNKEFRAQTQKNIRKKTRLCELAEALVDEEDLAVAVREINNLHKKWKKIGPVPKENNDELWDRFNEATRKFNERKIENLDVIRDQEQENLNVKLKLCEKAESLSGRTDWNDATAEMDALMKAWKDAGPVPRRKAGKLWKRFKKAMDTFYEARRNHFKSIRDDQKINYEKKKEIVAELVKLGEHEDPEEAVQQAKPLQERFRSIGFVPIKKKQKIENEYKEACDRIYQKLRGSGRKSGSVSDSQGAPNKSLRADYFKLKKECENLHEEIMRYQDTKTFINPGGKGNDLIDEIQQKIDAAQMNLDKKQDKLEELRRKMEE